MKLTNIQKTTVCAAALLMLGLSSCQTSLYRASARGDVQKVKAELADGANPNAKAPSVNLLWQAPALPVCVAADVVQFALVPGTLGIYTFIRGAVPKDDNFWLTSNMLSYGDKTPMDIATSKEYGDVITELILAGGNASDWAKIKAITEAARKGDAETLRKLMAKGCNAKADWNCTGEYKPLMLAIGNGHEECARILLENGASFYSTATIQGKEISCFDYASAKGQVELYKKLGGATTLAPVSAAKKTLSFKVTKTDNDNLVDYADSFKWGKGNQYEKSLRLKDLNKFERQIAKEAGETGPWLSQSLNYTKTGYKTATVEEFDQTPRFICNEYTSIKMDLTFDTPTSGSFTGEYSSRNRNGAGQISGTFTLK